MYLEYIDDLSDAAQQKTTVNNNRVFPLSDVHVDRNVEICL